MPDIDWDNLGAQIPIGIKDKLGNEIHLGDWMVFDYDEFYKHHQQKLADPARRPVLFQITLIRGEICKYGSFSDLSEFCTITKKGG